MDDESSSPRFVFRCCRRRPTEGSPAHGAWSQAIDRCLTTHYCSTAYFRCLSLRLRMQGMGGQDKFLPALPRPPAGPFAIEAPANERAGLG
jgi:hypothetical protein